MMYIADLHIHSRYSRATSKECTPEYLDLYARRKGIHILGTGDFTHSAWREELKEKLTPAEEGLYILKEEYRIKEEGATDSFYPRFVISGEISSIYKKFDKVRKVHSVILLPGLSQAELLAKKLESIGNIHSDGRPILGLDCRDLLEITLNLCPRAIYVPAHIWTPHFSLFGAFSGFDSIEECFGDLASHIHALETGLSSDPPMNWRISALDKYQLISNSDAHSPSKLGREANLLSTDLSYTGLYQAIQEGKGLEGTIEFFPEEGKYHYDGHRKCQLCLAPSEAELWGNICPVCKKKLTIGVSHRVEQLADREEGYVLPGGKRFESLVPLPEVIAASTGRSAASVKVERQYQSMVRKLGTEFCILREIPLEDIRHVSGYLISEGIRRLREGTVVRFPGYDGEYGTIKLFQENEIHNLNGQLSLFPDMSKEEGEAFQLPFCRPVPVVSERKQHMSDGNEPEGIKAEAGEKQEEAGCCEGLNHRQLDAVTRQCPVISVTAGPGTGKTKTLVSRILYLLQERKARPSEITAVTFTNQAAKEMRTRLENQTGQKRLVKQINIDTFHSICYNLIKTHNSRLCLADEIMLADFAEEIVGQYALNMSALQFLRQVSLMKNSLLKPEDETFAASPLKEAMEHYSRILRQQELLDYDDLLLETIKLFSPDSPNEIQKQQFPYLLVDEFQDISPVQYRLIKVWHQTGKELFVIGDPDQAVYSFRGSDERCFERLYEDYPDAVRIRLTDNYRSTPQIVKGAAEMIFSNGGWEREITPVCKDGGKIRIVTAKTGLSEGIFIAKEINRLIGGIDMLDSHGQPSLDEEKKLKGFSDIAVLYRTHRQAELLEKCLKKEGIPYIVAGREEFLTQSSVRGSISFFRCLLNKEDILSRKLCHKLLWKQNEAQALVEGAPEFAENLDKYLPRIKKDKPKKLIDSWIKDMDFEEDTAMQKLAGMSLFYKNMEEFLEAVAFGEEGDLKRCMGKGYTRDAVTLTTLHGSKGLEFPVVMVSGVTKGFIPLQLGFAVQNLEEERRLFYVGMTRAMEQLILIRGSEPSEFIDDIGKDIRIEEDAVNKQNFNGMRQMSLFDFM